VSILFIAAAIIGALLLALSIESRARFGVWIEPRTFHPGNIAAWFFLWLIVAAMIWVSQQVVS